MIALNAAKLIFVRHPSEPKRDEGSRSLGPARVQRNIILMRLDSLNINQFINNFTGLCAEICIMLSSISSAPGSGTPARPRHALALAGMTRFADDPGQHFLCFPLNVEAS